MTQRQINARLIEAIKQLLPIAEARLNTFDNMGPRKKREMLWERETTRRDISFARSVLKEVKP